MEPSKLNVILTDCRKCRVMPELMEAHGDYPGNVRLECPKCHFALESSPETVGVRWNSINKDKIKVTAEAGEHHNRWVTADYRTDPNALSDDIDYNGKAMGISLFNEL